MSPTTSLPADQPPLHLVGARKVRALGWLLIVLGPCLSVGTVVIASSLHQTIVHGNDPGARSHWNGSPELTRMAFELFGAVFLFGLVALAAGVFQVGTGRRNRVLLVFMLLVVAAMFYLGYGVYMAASAGALRAAERSGTAAARV